MHVSELYPCLRFVYLRLFQGQSLATVRAKGSRFCWWNKRSPTAWVTVALGAQVECPRHCALSPAGVAWITAEWLDVPFRRPAWQQYRIHLLTCMISTEYESACRCQGPAAPRPQWICLLPAPFLYIMTHPVSNRKWAVTSIFFRGFCSSLSVGMGLLSHFLTICPQSQSVSERDYTVPRKYMSHLLGPLVRKSLIKRLNVELLLNLIFWPVRIFKFRRIPFSNLEDPSQRSIAEFGVPSKLAYFIFRYFSTKLGNSIDGREQTI
jgi:hypothetical protein